MPRENKLIAKNKKARHDYFIDETFEAGIELTGTEVKSLRDRGTALRDSFATIRRGEAWLHNVHIPPYSHGNRANVDPDRTRRLLLHKKEIRYLQGKTQERGYTLVPLSHVLQRVEPGQGRTRSRARKEAVRQAGRHRRTRSRTGRGARSEGAHAGIVERLLPQSVGSVRTPCVSTGVYSSARVTSYDLREHIDIHLLGATGFDTIVLREEAGRGRLTSQNRGNSRLSVDNDLRSRCLNSAATSLRGASPTLESDVIQGTHRVADRRYAAGTYHRLGRATRVTGCRPDRMPTG